MTRRGRRQGGRVVMLGSGSNVGPSFSALEGRTETRDTGDVECDPRQSRTILEASKPIQQQPASPLEQRLLLAMRASGLPEPEQQYRFAPPRRWRIDFAWPSERLAVEIEGGAFRGPGHRSVGVFLRNIDKYNQLTMHGWRLLRFHSDQVKSGEAVELIRQALEPAPPAGSAAEEG